MPAAGIDYEHSRLFSGKVVEDGRQATVEDVLAHHASGNARDADAGHGGVDDEAHRVGGEPPADDHGLGAVLAIQRPVRPIDPAAIDDAVVILQIRRNRRSTSFLKIGGACAANPARDDQSPGDESGILERAGAKGEIDALAR